MGKLKTHSPYIAQKIIERNDLILATLLTEWTCQEFYMINVYG